jgi:hypothetical protein
MQRKYGLMLTVAGAVLVALAAYALFLNPADTPLTTRCGTESGTGCAPQSKRVDLVTASFSNPTKITNPLFPASEVVQTLLLGNVDGHPLRVEYTLLPGTEAVEWNGQAVQTRVVQYVAYLDRRIEEVALDRYAQADDGSVWYFGEDVTNYRDGVVENTEGTWRAGKDGPPAMIMPANPKIGDVYRVENIPGIVFEEITVRQVGVTVDGPHGPVTGGMIGDQLHVDGSHSDKTFAPGYGEFSTSRGGDIEAVSLAVPADTLSGPVPPELEVLLAGATNIFQLAASENWSAVSATLNTMRSAWSSFRSRGHVPELLAAQMNRALVALAGDALSPAVTARNIAGARKAAIDVGQAGLDLKLRHRPVADIDLARLELWARQLLLDAGSEDPGATVIGDVACLELIRDRIGHALQASDLEALENLLRDLRIEAQNHDFAAAAATATRLRDWVQRLEQ